MSEIKLTADSGGGSVSFKGPATTTSNAAVPFVLPVADGSAGQYLKTDGSKNLSFATVSTPDSDKIEEGNTSAEVVDTGSDGHFKVTTEGTEVMRINNDGTVACTTGNTVYTASVAGAIRMQLIHTGGGDVTWSNPSSGTATYSTSSDYRLKQDVVTLPDAWSTVKALKPYEYKWKHNTSKTSQGFFAHEVIATVPNSQAGQGTKDAVDEDGKPIYQQIDYSKLVPVLTKALQEAITEIETLKTKVAALEAS